MWAALGRARALLQRAYGWGPAPVPRPRHGGARAVQGRSVLLGGRVNGVLQNGNRRAARVAARQRATGRSLGCVRPRKLAQDAAALRVLRSHALLRSSRQHTGFPAALRRAGGQAGRDARGCGASRVLSCVGSCCAPRVSTRPPATLGMQDGTACSHV